MELKIKELKNIEEVLLCKVNRSIIGELKIECIINQSRNIDDLDELEFEVKKYYTSTHTKEKKINPYYEFVINERLICADEEYYVIKNISENKKEGVKNFKCYGLEKKLEKINFVANNIGIMLVDKDEEHNIYSFNDELVKLTGWSLNYIDDSVRYMDDGQPKMRMQESTDVSFYQFINETIRDQFCCIPIFNRKNKTIDLYDYDSFGDELKIVLSKDNYIKNLIKESDSNDIATRLTLKGNSDKCVVEEFTPTGFDYIENYSYFVQTKEMSEELITSIELFEKLTVDRMKEWKNLTIDRRALYTEWSDKNAQEDILQAEITQLKALIDEYKNMETEERKFDVDHYIAMKTLKQEECNELTDALAILDDKLKEIDDKLNKINILCRRETALDSNGQLIFTGDLLDELKEFTYYDTYSDDSFIDAKELIKTGEIELERRCKPTIEFQIDSVNFLDRIITLPYRKQWQGELGLGDIVALYDKEKDTEEYLYFVGWRKNYKTKQLDLVLSNKKTKTNTSKSISDVLKNAKNDKKIISGNKYLWNNQKYNKIENEIINTDLKLDPPILIEKYRVVSVELSAESLELDEGQEESLIATILPDNAYDKSVVWSSSDNTVATVTNGIVKGIKYGKCVISVITQDGNKVDSCDINVGQYLGEIEDVKVTDIRLNTNNVKMNINSEIYLVPEIFPLDATNKKVTFSSSDEKVAIVNSEGMILGKATGTCIIYVNSDENANIKISCIVSVTDKTNPINISNLDNSLFLGEGRVLDIQTLKIVDNIKIDAKDDVTGGYFYGIENNRLSKYPVNPTSAIVMLGKSDTSSKGILEMKTLIEQLVKKYTNKKIFIIEELPTANSYENYKSINEGISKFNSSIKAYCNGLNVGYINANEDLVSNSLLNSYYTTDGYKLDRNGYKLLWNNISTEIINLINSYNVVIDDDNNGGGNDNKPKPKPDSTKRNNIVARAEEIYKMCKNGKAWYSQYNRTIDWNNKQVIKSSSETISGGTYRQPGRGKYGFDCSSLVGVCYQAAGYNFMKGLSCAGGTLQSVSKKHNATMWRWEDDKDLKKAKPGDIVMYANNGYKVTKTNMATVRTHHTAVYIGNGMIIEASGYSSGILRRKRTWNKQCFFMRISELTKEDNKSTKPPDINDSDSNNSNKTGTNCYDEKGNVSGVSYIYKFTKARCTAYGGKASASASGSKMTAGKSCAAHNMPYGTKLYIPGLKGKFGNSTGVYTVHDTGGKSKVKASLL